MSVNVSIKQAILGVSGIVLASKFLGFIREMVIAERFGTSMEYDIYLLAIAGPVFFNLVIVHTTNYLTVPYLAKKVPGQPDHPDWSRVWSVFNSLLVIVLAIVALIIIAAPVLVHLIGPNLAGESFDTGVFYCRLIAGLLVLGFIESFLRSVLNVRKRFAYPAMGTILLNITTIVIIYLFSGSLSVGAILAGILVGSLVQVIFLSLGFARKDIFRAFKLELFKPEVKTLLTAGGAIISVEFLTSTYFLIDRYFASDMTEGVVSALNYCSLLVMLPASIVGYAIATVSFPYLSERSGSDEITGFGRLLRSALSLAILAGLPCAVFYTVFARELTAAVFFRGAFDVVSLEITSRILTMLGPYLLCLFGYTILIQACYALGRQRAVLAIAAVSVIIKFSLTGILKDVMGYPGIGLATSLVFVFSATMLLTLLARAGRLQKAAHLVAAAGKIIVASIPIVVVGCLFDFTPEYHEGMNLLDKLRIVPIAAALFFGFVIIGYLINIEQLRNLISGFWKGKNDR